MEAWTGCIEQSVKRSDFKFFFHPLPLAAVAVMFINDSYLKFKFPGLVTGKLSDFLGVFYFPLLLSLLFLVLHRFIDKSSYVKFSLGLLFLMIALTDVLFISVKLNLVANHMVTAFLDLFVPSRIVMDPADLMALVMNPFTYFFAKSFIKS